MKISCFHRCVPAKSTAPKWNAVHVAESRFPTCRLRWSMAKWTAMLESLQPPPSDVHVSNYLGKCALRRLNSRTRRFPLKYMETAPVLRQHLWQQRVLLSCHLVWRVRSKSHQVHTSHESQCLMSSLSFQTDHDLTRNDNAQAVESRRLNCLNTRSPNHHEKYTYTALKACSRKA